MSEENILPKKLFLIEDFKFNEEVGEVIPKGSVGRRMGGSFNEGYIFECVRSLTFWSDSLIAPIYDFRLFKNLKWKEVSE